MMLWPAGFGNPCICNPEGTDGAAGNSGLLKATGRVNHGCRSSGGSRVPRAKAARILNGKSEIVLEWQPWESKRDDTTTC